MADFRDLIKSLILLVSPAGRDRNFKASTAEISERAYLTKNLPLFSPTKGETSKPLQLYSFDLPTEFPPTLLQAFQKTLSVHELKLSLSRQFIALKLREILSESLGILPQLIEFKTKNKGKPIISPSQNPLNLSFNLSHSKSRVFIAISPHEIGVDIEEKTRTLNAIKIAQRFFHPQEYQEYQTCLEAKDKDSVDLDLQQNLFLKLWTEKEALIKCEGESLAAFLKISTKDYVNTHQIKIYSWQDHNFFYAVAVKP